MTKRERTILRGLTERNLKRKYELLFLNSLQFEGFDYRVDDYFMRKLLTNGEIAAFKLDSKDLEDESWLGLASFTIFKYDWKGDPLYFRPINEFNNPLIPREYLDNGKEGVILRLGFTPISFINEYVARVLDIQDTIDTNLITHKMPFIIKSTDPKTIKAIHKILENEPIIWVESNMFEVLDTKVPYIIDKLTLYKSEVEGELLSLLGIDNVKFEKKAQMTVDEVTSNDDEISAYRNVIKERINKFFKEVKEVLGFDLSIKEPEPKIENNENGDDDYDL